MLLRFIKSKANAIKDKSECSPTCALHTYSIDTIFDSETRYVTRAVIMDQCTAAKYLYQAIYDWEVRILALNPGKFGDPLIARFHLGVIVHDGNVVLHQQRLKTTYDALSYCLGDPIFNSSITCIVGKQPVENSNEHDIDSQPEIEVEFPIMESLYDALQRLRWKDKARYLWIDQLCINQSDLSERSLQVQKMLLIYRSASAVLVWLGEETPYTQLTISVIQKVFVVGSANRWMDSESGGDSHMLAAIKRQWCSDHYNSFLLGLLHLLSRPCYSRLWIKQEVWAAQEVVMIDGGQSISMTLLEDLSMELSQVRNDFPNPFLDLPRSRAIAAGPSPPTEDLLQALQRGSTSKCSNLRDYVYAVVGMTSACRDLRSGNQRSALTPLSVNYHQTVSQVFQDAVKYHVRRTRSFDIFIDLWGTGQTSSQRPVFGGEVNGCRLPSWCPNWSAPWTFIENEIVPEVGKLWNALRLRMRFVPGSQAAIDAAFGPNMLHLSCICFRSKWTNAPLKVAVIRQSPGMEYRRIPLEDICVFLQRSQRRTTLLQSSINSDHSWCFVSTKILASTRLLEQLCRMVRWVSATASPKQVIGMIGWTSRIVASLKYLCVLGLTRYLTSYKIAKIELSSDAH